MDVIPLDIQFVDIPSVDPGRLVKQHPQSDRHLADQHPLTILGYPDQMILKTVFGMCSCPIFWHDQSMPNLAFASLRAAIHPQA